MASDLSKFRNEQDFVLSCYQRVRAAWHERSRCRECGTRCSCFANVCETCGTQDPVRLPFTWALAAIGVCAAVILLRCAL